MTVSDMWSDTHAPNMPDLGRHWTGCGRTRPWPTEPIFPGSRARAVAPRATPYDGCGRRGCRLARSRELYPSGANEGSPRDSSVRRWGMYEREARILIPYLPCASFRLPSSSPRCDAPRTLAHAGNTATPKAQTPLLLQSRGLGTETGVQ